MPHEKVPHATKENERRVRQKEYAMGVKHFWGALNQEARAMVRWMLVGAVAVALGLAAVRVEAAIIPITPSNFDTIDPNLLGNVVATQTSAFTPGAVDLMATVYENPGTFTYVLEVIPDTAKQAFFFITEFNTTTDGAVGFDPNPTGHLAGYSFSQALAAVGSLPTGFTEEHIFSIVRESDVSLDFNASPWIPDFWTTGGPITFFFQSTEAPGQITYNLIREGSTTNLGPVPGPAASPVPESGTLLLFGTGLVGMGAFTRRRSRRS